MNIVGDDANYLRSLIFNFASMSADDLMGMVFNRTLYFIENWCIMYEVELPEHYPVDLICCFWRNNENPGSFSIDNTIIDRPDLFSDMVEKIKIITYCAGQPVFVDEDCLDDKQFETLSKYRPTDGGMKYFVDSSLRHSRTFTTVDKSFFKLNKADRLSVHVYEADYNRLLYKYTLFKKKYNRNINIYTLTLNLNNQGE